MLGALFLALASVTALGLLVGQNEVWGGEVTLVGLFGSKNSYAITITNNELTGTAANTGTFSATATVTIPTIDPHAANNAASVSTVVTATTQRPPSNAFFVASNGSDTNDCKTEATPCRTIAKINAGTYVPGTTIRFRGGDRFPGVLTITPTQVPSGGDKTNPIVIGSYGTGKATILANAPGTNNGTIGPKSYAVKVDSVSGVTVQNLIISANGTATQYGVLIQNSVAGSNVADTIVVQNNDISGFNTIATGDFSAEVFVSGLANCGALNNIKVLSNTLHGAAVTSSDDNGIYGQSCGHDIGNATYSGNTVFNIGGRPNLNGGTSGNGIVFVGVATGFAENNLVHDMAANVNTCGGPAGIWAYHSDHITVQLNEVHHMHATSWMPGACDWAAFDADSDTQKVVFQYNYSHDNDGPAWLVYGGEDLPHGPTVIRYNISVNDNLTNSNGGGSLSMPTSGVIQVYNNTVFKGFNRGGTLPPSCWSGGWGFNGGPAAGSVFANNICYQAATDQYGRAAYNIITPGNDFTNLQMRNNLYFGGNVWVAPDGSNPTTLAAWQIATGKDAGSLVGNPMFFSNVAGGSAGFALTPGSPAIGAGLDLTQVPYSLNVGTRDFFGNPVSKNIGADAAVHP